jgi:hypothetical protein
LPYFNQIQSIYRKLFNGIQSTDFGFRASLLLKRNNDDTLEDLFKGWGTALSVSEADKMVIDQLNTANEIFRETTIEPLYSILLGLLQTQNGEDIELKRINSQRAYGKEVSTTFDYGSGWSRSARTLLNETIDLLRPVPSCVKQGAGIFDRQIGLVIADFICYSNVKKSPIIANALASLSAFNAKQANNQIELGHFLELDDTHGKVVVGRVDLEALNDPNDVFKLGQRLFSETGGALNIRSGHLKGSDLALFGQSSFGTQNNVKSLINDVSICFAPEIERQLKRSQATRDLIYKASATVSLETSVALGV